MAAAAATQDATQGGQRAPPDPSLPEAIEIMYKPHPREPLAALRAAWAGLAITLAEPAEDAYQLLSRCMASVTVYSTLAIEALAFPCRSIVVRSRGPGTSQVRCAAR